MISPTRWPSSAGYAAASCSCWAYPRPPDGGSGVSPRGADIEVDPISLLTGWLTGTSLPGLADEHLTTAADPAWRIEQMVDAMSKHFEHYLAWTIGALTELVNTRLAAAGLEDRLCPDLGSYIRYGVNDAKALLLMASGIRSRRLAHAIAADLPADLEPVREQLRVQIARMGIAQWRTRYNASAAEVLDLLDFTRIRSRSLLRTLLETGSATVELPPLPATAPTGDGPLTVEPDRDELHPAPLAGYAADQRIATIAAQDHADLQAILDTGLAITAELGGNTSAPVLSISLPLAD